MTTVLITNRKGGVGKTTTTLFLANEFAQRGYKVLLVDLDTQGHIQYGLGVKHGFEYGIHSILKDNTIDIKLIIQKSSIKNISFIPANINFNPSSLQNTKALKKVLKKVTKTYDIVLIDTAPASDTVLKMAIYASDYVLVPMKSEYLGLIGTVQFIKIFYSIASRLKTNFKLLGIIPTLYSKSLKEHQETIAELKQIVGDKRVLQPIRKDVKLTTIFKKGIRFLKKEHSRGMEDYRAVADLILNRIQVNDK